MVQNDTWIQKNDTLLQRPKNIWCYSAYRVGHASSLSRMLCNMKIPVGTVMLCLCLNGYPYFRKILTFWFSTPCKCYFYSN